MKTQNRILKALPQWIVVLGMGLMIWEGLGTRPSHAKEVDEIIFSDIRLMASDLVDEMVYGWLEKPPAGEKTRLVLVGVYAPIGLDARFKEIVENRLYELLAQNPKIPIELTYCGPCTHWIAKSNSIGTYLGPGIDQPEILSDVISNRNSLNHGLILNFEAEGQDLVLRALIFTLDKDQRIIWARNIPTSLTAQRVLRQTTPLISLKQAREEQDMILRRQDTLEVTTRLVTRLFNGSGSGPLAALPLPFVEQSFEAIPLPRRRYRSGITFGFSSIQRSLQAWSVGGHLAGLMIRDTPSLMNPDLYWVLGAHYVRMRGPGAAVFSEKQMDVETILRINAEPKATLVAWRLGLEAHIKHRLGLLMFLEDIPLLKDNRSFNKESFLLLPYYAYGFGMVIRW